MRPGDDCCFEGSLQQRPPALWDAAICRTSSWLFSAAVSLHGFTLLLLEWIVSFTGSDTPKGARGEGERCTGQTACHLKRLLIRCHRIEGLR